MAKWSGRRWSSKQYLLAALLGTFVAIVAAAAISISLAPGHVSFNVKQAQLPTIPHKTLSEEYFYFTVVAINTSKRMAVRYASLTAEIWYSEQSWIPADDINTTTLKPGWWWPRGTPAVVDVWADRSQFNVKDGNEAVPSQMTNNGRNDTDKLDVNWPNCRVRLEAKVWFRLWLIPTKPYTIAASCFPVNFQDGKDSVVNCV